MLHLVFERAPFKNGTHMTKYALYYATNRNHIGEDRWHPTSYGTKFSDDGMENLRFGVVTISANEETVAEHLNARMQNHGKGDGESLASYLTSCAKRAQIHAYEERIKKHIDLPLVFRLPRGGFHATSFSFC